MSTAALRARWRSGEGAARAEGVVAFLAGASRVVPAGVGMHEGRLDLRGLSWSLLRPVAMEAVRGARVAVLEGVVELRGVVWRGLDLSHAELPGLRFFDSRIEDCRFDGANCADWRLWASQVADCSFVGAKLKDASIGTWWEEKANSWRRVVFDGADLRGALVEACLLEDCSFGGTRVSGVDFDQVRLRRCRFSGLLREVMFEGRTLPRRAAPAPLVDVDFGEALFEDVEFRGCTFEGVRLPEGVRMVPGYPGVARRGLELLAGDESVDARMLRGQFENDLKLPGSEDSVGVYNRRDYVASGGEGFADFAEVVLGLRAAGSSE